MVVVIFRESKILLGVEDVRLILLYVSRVVRDQYVLGHSSLEKSLTLLLKFFGCFLVATFIFIQLQLMIQKVSILNLTLLKTTFLKPEPLQSINNNVSFDVKITFIDYLFSKT